MAAILTQVSSVVTSAISWLGTTAAAVTATGNEILLLFVVAVPLVGLGVGLFTRMIHVRG